jgi:hypothetical protein
MFISEYKSVQIIAPERRYLALVQAWFDGLGEGDVKEAIRQIRWREMRPQLSSFRLIVVCRHPYADDVKAHAKSKEQEDPDVVAEASCKLLNRFEEWIEVAGMPRETVLDERSARITWSAQEVPYFDPDSLPPQERAQHDLNRQASSFLWLVHVSAQTGTDLVKSMVGTNIPFASTGLLLTGHVRMIRRFPPEFPDSETERDCLHENLLEHPADYVILMRLASHFGCRHALVARVLAAKDRFLREHAKSLPIWLAEYTRTEEEDFVSDEPVVDPKLYETLDVACETYRHELVTATEGLENELADVLNSFLGELPVPDGPFAAELLDDGEWWKRGDE